MPTFPAQYIHYLRMNVRDLTPNEYWLTGEEDYETACMVQEAWRKGVTDAEETHRAMQGGG